MPGSASRRSRTRDTTGRGDTLYWQQRRKPFSAVRYCACHLSASKRHIEVEMSTSEPMDPQRYGETSQPSGLPTDLEATLPLASPPQPIAPATPQAVAPLPATRQTLPPPIPSAPLKSRRSPLGWLVVAGALAIALIVAGAGVNAWEASQPTAGLGGRRLGRRPISRAHLRSAHGGAP